MVIMLGREISHIDWAHQYLEPWMKRAAELDIIRQSSQLSDEWMAALGKQVDQLCKRLAIMIGGICHRVGHIGRAEEVFACIKIVEPAVM